MRTLSRQSEFDALFRQGTTYRFSGFAIKFLADPEGFGYAVRVSKKNYKKATMRNFVKRRLRHLVWQTPNLPKGKLLLLANKETATLPFSTLQEAFQGWLKENQQGQ